VALGIFLFTSDKFRMAAKAHLLTVDYVGFSLEIKLAADLHQAPSITFFSSPTVAWCLDIVTA
jgi:hypothetical protein